MSLKSKIARKIIVYTVLFSSGITLLITSIQLYNEFQHDVTGINQKLNQIKISYKKSITDAVWVSDTNQLQTILNGITELPDIILSKVESKNTIGVSSGISSEDEVVTAKVELNYFYNNKEIHIGDLTVVASLIDVYKRMYNRLWIILLSNALKTALVVIFIYFLFARLVTRHLTTISDYSENYDSSDKNKKLVLNRSRHDRDEFDSVVESINGMHERLREQVAEINKQISEVDKQKQNLSQTLNSIGDAVIATDEKGNVTRMNPVAEDLTGWSLQEAQGQPLKAVFPIVNASTREPIENPVDKVIATGETIYLSNHTTLISKDGTEYQIADSAAAIRSDDKILGMVLVFNDVTEQYRLRQDIINSEKKYQILATVAPVGIFYTDAQGGCLYVNKKWSEITGISFENAKGDGWLKGLFHEDKDLVFAQWSRLANEGIPFKLEYRFQHEDGICWVLGEALAEKGKDDETIGYVGTITDITDRKEKDEQLRRSQKMDALGKLTGGIVHDYNNMLGIVLGYSDLIKEMAHEQPKLTEYINEIRHAGERGAKLTKNLLTFSRHDSSENKIVNLNTLLESSQHMLEKTLTVRISLVYELEKNCWPIHLDEGDLEDAILNMSINAMHSIEGTGQLTFETRNEAIKEIDAQHLEIPAGDYVLLSIADTGCGMDTKTKENIFDPFFSTKGEFGTGLGLSQVYGFTQRSKGNITILSELGHGSLFTLYFPRHYENEPEDKQFKEEDGTNLSGNQSILVVDDEPALATLTSHILTQQGYQAFIANNAKEALLILAKEHIDVLLTDVIMPEMDGYELAAIVQEKYPNIKIQLASGFNDDRHVNNINDSLHENLLHKPYHSKKLLLRIRELLNGSAD